MKNANRVSSVHCLVLIIGLSICPGSLATAEDLPRNLAPLAKVSASSQFSDGYRPAMAVNDVIPSEFKEDQDWAVKNTQTGWFTLQWDQH